MRLKESPYSPFFAVAATFIVSLSIIKAFDISFPVSVTNKNVSSELSVVGEGKIDVVPDTAELQAGIVVSDAKTVQDAQKRINEVHNKVVLVLVKLGVKKEDIKTSNYSINPNYNFEGGQNNITGYSGNATISIKVRKMEILGAVIEAVTVAGVNQIFGTQYNIDNPQGYREKARDLAIENARQQAEKIAGQLGIKLGRIVNIVESSPQAPSPLYLREAQGIGGTTPNIEPGTQTITSVVTLYFERK